MLSLDDLKKLRGVIKEESTDLESKLRLVIREEVDKRAEETETKMEHRFNAVDKRFDTVDRHFEKLEKQMEQDRKDWSGFFNEAGVFFDEMRTQLARRITKLEENQRISKN